MKLNTAQDTKRSMLHEEECPCRNVKKRKSNSNNAASGETNLIVTKTNIILVSRNFLIHLIIGLD